MKSYIFSGVALLLAGMLLMTACDRGENPTEAGAFELNLRPTVGGQDFIAGRPYQNIQGRTYQLDEFKMYIANIRLVKESGEELPLADIELFDLVRETVTRGVSHGAGTFSLFENVPAGTYAGVKFGIGVPENMNTSPADYATDHPLSVNTSMYWSWRTGYKFISLEGKIDASQEMTGAVLDQSLVYHTGRDSVNSPNQIYREVSYLRPQDAFTIESGRELQFIIEMDINRFFYNEQDTISMHIQNFTHSVPGEQFNLSVEITDNLVSGALFKLPF
ncbi:MAG: MbnP family protein [Bacteroidota bacterium]